LAGVGTGLVACGTEVGCLAGAPAIGVGGLAIVGGGAVATTSIKSIAEQVAAISASGGRSFETLEDAKREIKKWKVEENLEKADSRHLEAVRRERMGEVLPNSEPDGHIRELRSALQGLRKARDRIRAALRSPGWDSEARQYMNETLDQISDSISILEDALYGPIP
jgi:hypothetical protein